MPHAFLQPNGVLGNKLGITDGEKLSQIERELTKVRIPDAERATEGMPFNFERLQTIHKTLFQDIYDWAGKERVTNLYKQNVEFTPRHELDSHKEKLFSSLEQDHFLRGLPRETFADKAADLMSSLNRLHPFPEGNGRTQRMFMKQLAEQAGHTLDFSVVSSRRNIETSIDATLGDPAPMKRLFREITDPEKVQDLKLAFQDLQRNGIDAQQHYVTTTTPGRDYTGTLLGRIDGERVIFQDNRSKDLVVVRVREFTKLPQQGQTFTLKTAEASRGLERGSSLER